MEEENETTTIKVLKKTVERLERLKIHPRQALEEVIVELLDKDEIPAEREESRKVRER